MLEIKNLKKKYASFCLDCSLSVKPGAITGLVGQNGAGKSTTFKSALGLIRFDEGEIKILGKDIHDLTAKDKESLGVVLSDSGFSGYLTIGDITAILKNMYKDFDSGFFKENLTRFGLPTNKKIKDFSTGMKAKLKILTALCHRAKLLILDEPTAGLDVVARDEILLLLREYMEKDEERAILISSHISSDLETLCDDIYMIHEGKIILHEDTDTLLDRYGIIKLGDEEYSAIDKEHILYIKKEAYGVLCLTDEIRYYKENYPSAVIERANIDSTITLMIKGERQ